MEKQALRTTQGCALPLGATVSEHGINFAVFSRNATSVELLLFEHPDDDEPSHTIKLVDLRHRTGDIWHIFVHGLGDRQLYAYRVDGPYLPRKGHRYNKNKVLIDPYSKAIGGNFDIMSDAVYGYDRRSLLLDLSFSQQDSCAYTARSVAIADSQPDWDVEKRPRYPLHETVIYECHVKGMTAGLSQDRGSISDVQDIGIASSGGTKPKYVQGTYLALIERIPHLVDLGVTTLELLPVNHFNVLEPPTLYNPVTKQQNVNYWGYATLGFFAPHAAYAASSLPGASVDEFRQLVRACHAAGIEVILDVVFNHSGEGSEMGPTLVFKGFDNAIYYAQDSDGRYRNYSGCGNTLNCNHPVMKQLILDALRYWVTQLHVDGFRFDLATILGRSHAGKWISDPDLGLLSDISQDPVLKGCKLIAESWDAAGLYKVGEFPHGWAEWNGRFRDDVRRFLRGDNGSCLDFAKRIGGSFDLFGSKINASHSINFITCHDGFTLRDLCSYAQKHNEANGEENRDGSNENFSDNCGVEGESDRGDIRAKRIRRAKHFIMALLLSRGTPMILSGDEIWHTQGGNNNVFCQDNEISWLDWQLDEMAQNCLTFFRQILMLRRQYAALRNIEFVDPTHAQQHGDTIRWHGTQLFKPDFSHDSHSLAFELLPPDAQKAPRFYVVFNMWREALSFALPKRKWHKLIDTSIDGEEGFLMPHESQQWSQPNVVVAADSACVFYSNPSQRYGKSHSAMWKQITRKKTVKSKDERS